MNAIVETLAALSLALILVVTLWFTHAPAPTVVGDKPVDHSSTSYHLVRPADAADGTFSIWDDHNSLVAGFHVRHNRVSVLSLKPLPGPDGQVHPIHTSYTRDLYAWDTDLDVGTWAGYSTADTAHFQSGIRYAPVRLLYGTTALDLVASRDLAGVGVSVFPPVELLTDGTGDDGWALWQHIGLGAWYCAPFRGGHPGLVYGCSFSTHE